MKFPRSRSSATATAKMELFVIIVNGFQSLTIITKSSINYYHKELHLGCCSSPVPNTFLSSRRFKYLMIMLGILFSSLIKFTS